MPAPRTNRRQLASLAFIVHAILNEIAEAGGPVGESHRHALALVDAFVGGERVKVSALRDAAAAVRSANAGWGVGSPPLEKALHWLPLESLLGMVQSGDDESGLVLTHANYAVPGLDWGGRTRRIDALKVLATEHAASFSDDPLPAKPKRVSAATREKEAAALARVRAALHPAVASLLDRIGAGYDAKRVASANTLRARLTRAGYAPNSAVSAFEATFGGLLIASSMSVDDWRERGLFTLVGVNACVGSGWTSYPRGGPAFEGQGLVPIAQGPNDDVYFLDPSGRAYYHETIGERNAEPFGASGADLVTRLVLGSALFFDMLAGPLEQSPAESAATRANEHGLELVSEDEQSRWWLGPSEIVVTRREGAFARKLTGS